MSKKKEIEVWVYTNNKGNSLQEFGKEKWINMFHPSSPGIDKRQMTKATLIIEEPERRIEITESEFDEAVLKLNIPGDWEVTRAIIADVKSKLFRKEE